jgi:hypothetical protein
VIALIRGPPEFAALAAARIDAAAFRSLWLHELSRSASIARRAVALATTRPFQNDAVEMWIRRAAFVRSKNTWAG